MNDAMSLAQIQRSMLLRSIYLLFAPMMMLFASLACGTIVTDTASYTCPTAVPRATVTTLAGTPMPTLPPPPTPYTMTSPQDFYIGDAVFVGQASTPLRLRFRLQNVQSRPASSLGGSPRNLVTWQLEIRNLGSTTYEAIGKSTCRKFEQAMNGSQVHQALAMAQDLLVILAQTPIIA